MRRTIISLFLVVTACKPSAPLAPPAPEVPSPPPMETTCDLHPWAALAVNLGTRAQAGESVVTTDGCSLFDGKLLARGFPRTDAEALKMLSADDNCVPTLALPSMQLRLVKVDDKAMVSLARMVTKGEASSLEPPQPKDWETALMRAARCPPSTHRLQTDKDAQMALAYAIGLDALETAVGGGTPPSTETRESMAKLCKPVGAFAPVGDPKNARASGEKNLPRTESGTLDVDPLAATALVMAGSFTVFGEAATRFKLSDDILRSVTPIALGVIARPPHSNVEGACAVWSMALSIFDRK